MRKIAVITGTRADYGLLYWIINAIQAEPELELELIVSCMHLSPEFGLTVQEIEKDGFPIADKVLMLLSADTPNAISASMGLGMIGFAAAYEKLCPHIILVLGDRYEILAATAAAVPFGIPVAHIHGGEATEGSMDELFRHAVTKMSQIHFAATKNYANRIVQMGERPERVFSVGAPGLDGLLRLNLLERQELQDQLGLPEGSPLGVVTYHPETLGAASTEKRLKELLSAIDGIRNIFWIFTSPNADTGSRKVIQMIKDFVSKKSNKCKFFKSLGHARYVSLMKNAAVMVGNSSSGIIEAPSFQLPVVNLGDRQKGRIRAANVLDVPIYRKGHIIKAIKTAFSKEFTRSLKDLKNPYGDGNSSKRIVEVLKTISLEEMTNKTFYDLSDNT